MFVDDPCIKECALPLDVIFFGEMVNQKWSPFMASFLGLVPKRAVANCHGILESRLGL
jgi:hypothetical protein